MKDLEPPNKDLSYYFNMGKLNTIPQKERNYILEDLRSKIFKFLEENLQTFSEDVLDFIFRGLDNLGIEFDDLISSPQKINKKIVDILFGIILKSNDCETMDYFSNSIKKICEVLRDSKGENLNIFNYLKKKAAFFLINFDFKTIQYLMDERIFNYLEEEVLKQIYENPKANLERKLEIALYETEGNYLSITGEAAIEIYIKLGEYGINPLLKWISQPYVDGIGSSMCSFFKKMDTKIVKPFKTCIAKSLLNKEFCTIYKLMLPWLIDLLDKKVIMAIFWDDNTLEHFIDLCLEMKVEILGDYPVNLIRKIGGDAFKLLHKAFKLQFFSELFVDVVDDFKKTKVEEIDNLKEGILYADKINDMGVPMIIILCDFLIKRISNEERRNFILNTNIVEYILEIRLPYPYSFNPLERLHFFAHEALRDKIFNIFMEPNIIAIARILNNISHYELLRGIMLTLEDWKSIIENPIKNFFETLTEAINYLEKDYGLGWHPSNFAYNIFQDFLEVTLNDTIRNQITNCFNQKNVNAIYSVFEIGLKNLFTKMELLTLIEDSFEVCVISQSRNYSNTLQNFIDDIFKKTPNVYRDIIYRILEGNSEYSVDVSKYAQEKGYLK